MKNLLSIILIVLTFLFILGLVGTIDRQGEELLTLKQLHNVQQKMLEENFSQQEIDSLYLEYNYYYLNNYYQNNY